MIVLYGTHVKVQAAHHDDKAIRCVLQCLLTCAPSRNGGERKASLLLKVETYLVVVLKARIVEYQLESGNRSGVKVASAQHQKKTAATSLGRRKKKKKTCLSPYEHSC